MILPSKAGEKPVFAIAIIITILALVSRFYGIWEWDLAGDEYFTALRSHERFTSIVNPAYYFLVVVFYSLFGESEWISRLPALLIGVASIPILFATWCRVVGRNAALYAALILVFSAWHLWFSQYARFYIGVFLFSSLAYYFYFRAIQVDRISYLIWALLFSLIAMLFHVTAVLVPISCAGAYLVMLVFQKSISDASVRIAKLYLIICVIAALGAIPVLFYILEGWVSKGSTWGYGSLLVIPQTVKYVQLPIVVSAFFGWILLINRWPMAAIFFAFGIGIPLLFITIAASSISVRPDYVFYILPLLVVLSGLACEIGRDTLDKNRSKVMPILVIALILSTLLPEFVSHYLAKRSLKFENAVVFVEKNYRPGDQILSFINGFNLLADREYELLPYISFERDPVTNWNEKLSSLLNSDRRSWIIISSKRKSLAPRLENWLLCHARLVWRQHATRLDYEVDGYQIFLVPAEADDSTALIGCTRDLA